jgi:hypothetical protein
LHTWGENTKPLWIIRNGVNDNPQDSFTTFDIGVNWGADSAGPNGNGALPFTSGAFYVKDAAGDTGDDIDYGTKNHPFKTLAGSYKRAVDVRNCEKIVVLSDLNVLDTAMTLDPDGRTPREIMITSDTADSDGPGIPEDQRRKLTRASTSVPEWAEGPLFNRNTAGPTVVKVTGGAKVIFQDIDITGNTVKESRALQVLGGGSTVTLNNTALTGELIGDIYCGGAVEVYDYASLIMNDGSTISGSTASYLGGGVYVVWHSSFTMNGGTISNNTAENPFNINVGGSGGGVCIENECSFTMNGGTISGNKSLGEGSGMGGGGVFVFVQSSFTMSGNSTVSGNRAVRSGGGVLIDANVTFTMDDDSKVIDNEAEGNGNEFGKGNGCGGGVCIGPESWGSPTYNTFINTFIMKGNSTVSGNKASVSGGGVSMGLGNLLCTFNMEGGTVSGNKATVSGGGISIGQGNESNTFTMTGGTVYGSNEYDTSLQNTAGSNAALDYLAHSTENTITAENYSGE